MFNTTCTYHCLNYHPLPGRLSICLFCSFFQVVFLRFLIFCFVWFDIGLFLTVLKMKLKTWVYQWAILPAQPFSFIYSNSDISHQSSVSLSSCLPNITLDLFSQFCSWSRLQVQFHGFPSSASSSRWNCCGTSKWFIKLPCRFRTRRLNRGTNVLGFSCNILFWQRYNCFTLFKPTNEPCSITLMEFPQMFKISRLERLLKLLLCMAVMLFSIK